MSPLQHPATRMVKPQAWPTIETSKPYNTGILHVAARPSPEHLTYPVDRVSTGDSKRPRPCIGPLNDLPGGPIYWCRSCDRRVANGKTPFCKRHQRQREQYMRDRRRAHNQRVRILRSQLIAIHSTAQQLEEHRETFISATDEKTQTEAHRRMLSTVENFHQWATTHLPPGTVEVRLRPLKDPP